MWSKLTFYAMKIVGSVCANFFATWRIFGRKKTRHGCGVFITDEDYYKIAKIEERNLTFPTFKNELKSIFLQYIGTCTFLRKLYTKNKTSYQVVFEK